MCNRCADLELEVADLKRELGLDIDERKLDRFRQRWALTGIQARILLALHNGQGSVRKERIMDLVYEQSPDEPGIKIIDVVICKMRAKMGKDAILTSWGAGYSLSPRGRAECDAVIKVGTMEDLREESLAPLRSLILDRLALGESQAQELAAISGANVTTVRYVLAGLADDGRIVQAGAAITLNEAKAA